jgi:hypothetical protein
MIKIILRPERATSRKSMILPFQGASCMVAFYTGRCPVLGYYALSELFVLKIIYKISCVCPNL